MHLTFLPSTAPPTIPPLTTCLHWYSRPLSYLPAPSSSHPLLPLTPSPLLSPPPHTLPSPSHPPLPLTPPIPLTPSSHSHPSPPPHTLPSPPTQPTILPTHIHHVREIIPQCDASLLVQLAKVLDPSQSTIKPLLLKAMAHPRPRSGWKGLSEHLL